MQSSSEMELIGRYLSAYNAFDVEGMLDTLTAQIRFENYTGGQLTASANGIEEFRVLAGQARLMFSEREQRVTRFESHDGAVIANIDYRGRLAVDIPDGPSAGTLLELQGTSEFSITAGKISRIIDRS